MESFTLSIIHGCLCFDVTIKSFYDLMRLNVSSWKKNMSHFPFIFFVTRLNGCKKIRWCVKCIERTNEYVFRRPINWQCLNWCSSFTNIFCLYDYWMKSKVFHAVVYVYSNYVSSFFQNWSINIPLFYVKTNKKNFTTQYSSLEINYWQSNVWKIILLSNNISWRWKASVFFSFLPFSSSFLN